MEVYFLHQLFIDYLGIAGLWGQNISKYCPDVACLNRKCDINKEIHNKHCLMIVCILKQLCRHMTVFKR